MNRAIVFLVGCALGGCGQNHPGDQPAEASAGGGQPRESQYDPDLEEADLGGAGGAGFGGAAGMDPCGDQDCTELSDGCSLGYCDQRSGTCKTRDAADGTPCDDADPCSVHDVCDAGVCVGAKLDCSALDDDCNVGACDAEAGACGLEPRNDGAGCDDASVCTTGDTCHAGNCEGTFIDCSASESACHVAECDPELGCTAVPLDAGSCDDADPCTVGDTCSAGVCAGEALDCSSLAGPCSTAACKPGAGGCVVTLLVDGTSCDDGSACTLQDTCQANSCVGTPKSCPSLGACKVPSCDAATGACGAENAADGTSCSDDDACTIGDHCVSGVCAGLRKSCPASTCMVATCEARTGACLEAPAPDGASCDADALDCTMSSCSGGVCYDTTRPDCSPCSAETGWVCGPNGTCGPPTLASTYGFDGVGVDVRFSTPTPGKAWAVTDATFFAGGGALRSATITDGERSAVELDVVGAASTKVAFWVTVASEAASAGKAGDALVLFIDNVEQKRWQGTLPWVRHSVSIPRGPHAMTLAYVKDAAGSAGLDAAFVDELVITDEPQPLSFVGNSLSPLQTSGDVPFVVSSPSSVRSSALPASEHAVLSLPLDYARSVNLGFWLEATLAATDGLTVTVAGSPALYTFDYSVPYSYWQLDVPAGATTVEWRVERGASSPSTPLATISDVAVVPAVCPSP